MMAPARKLESHGCSLSVRLSEWEEGNPTTHPALYGHFLDGDPAARQAAEALEKAGCLEITERRDGLGINARSWVGRINFGHLSLTISPKLSGFTLLDLVRYAYDLRDFRIEGMTAFETAEHGIADLLVIQLAQEAEEILRRGPARRYTARHETLSSPHGRINLPEIARRGGVVEARLPCWHHPRLMDWPLNQTLCGGLHMATRFTNDLKLQRQVRRLAGIFEQAVTSVAIDGNTLRRGERLITRMTEAYRSPMTLIRLLYEMRGVHLQADNSTLNVPGFLFDMNRFFQALLSRFLKEHLTDISIKDESRLRDVFTYLPDFNPRNKRSREPRPDYALLRQGRTIAYFDAKYRDIWTLSYPATWLYQLGIYATSAERRVSVLLYPTIAPEAREERVAVNDPISGARKGLVILRPVDMNALSKLVRPESFAQMAEPRRRFAERLAGVDVT